MAVTHVYAGTAGNITIDFTNQVISCAQSIETFEIQELVNAAREAEYSWEGAGFSKICNASGKEYLDIVNGVQVGITCVLLDNWVAYSEKISGVFRVVGGNLVQVSGGDPFKENSAITYINILSAASTIVTVSAGSGLSGAEHAKLMGLPDQTLEDDERTALLGVEEKVEELHKIAGLAAGTPLTVTPTQRSAGDINLVLSGDGIASTTVTRS